VKHLLAALLCLCLLALCACGQVFVPPEVTGEATTTITTAQPTTTQAPALPPIDYPTSYKDAPAAYKPVLDDLYRQMLLPGWDKPPDCTYAVVDINKDGILELLTNLSVPADHVTTLYTLKDNEPVELSWYSVRNRGHFAADGTIYHVGSGGTVGSLSSYKLKPGASELTQLTSYYCEPHGHYQVINGKDVPTAWEEYDALREKYDNPPNPMPLTFIPIEQ
jgi:hypothetical protein